MSEKLAIPTAWYAAGWGLMIWLAIAMIGGRAEAWDSPLYGLVGLPFLVIGSGAIGWSCPQRRWRHGFFVATGQGTGLMVSGLLSGGGFGLLPLGIVCLLILSLPLMAASAIGSFLRKRIRPPA